MDKKTKPGTYTAHTRGGARAIPSARTEDKPPCHLAILGRETSELRIVNMKDERGISVQISAYESRGIVTIDNRVYAVTEKEIIELHADGRRTVRCKLKHYVPVVARIVSFLKKIYIAVPMNKPKLGSKISPFPSDMLCFDPAHCSIEYLAGCRMEKLTILIPIDDFLYAMGWSENRCCATKYKPGGKNWSPLTATMSVNDHAAAEILNKRVIVMGGFQRTYGRYRSVNSYDQKNGKATLMTQMKESRCDFSACIIDGKLHAIGGTGGRKKNGVLKDSIEVYDQKVWSVIQKFESVGNEIFSSIWPHSHGPYPPDLLDDIKHLQNNARFLGTNTKWAIVGSDGGESELPGCKINFPPEAINKPKKLMFTLQDECEQDEDFLSITPVLACQPSTTFDKPVSIAMRTSMSSSTNHRISVILCTRDNPEDKWIEKEELKLGQKNVVQFQVRHLNRFRVIAKKYRGKFHVFNDIYVHRHNARIISVFTKNMGAQEKSNNLLKERNYVSLETPSIEVSGLWESNITVDMAYRYQQTPPKQGSAVGHLTTQNCRIEKSKMTHLSSQSVTFESKPWDLDYRGTLKMEYTIQVENEKEEFREFELEWPIGENRTGHMPSHNKPQNSGQDTSATLLSTGDNARVTITGTTVDIRASSRVVHLDKEAPAAPVVKITDTGLTRLVASWLVDGKQPASYIAEIYKIGNATKIKSVTTSKTSATFTDLLPGTEYQVRVRGVYATESKVVAPAFGSATGTTKSPQPPTVEIKEVGLTTLFASWSVDGPQPTKYIAEIYQPGKKSNAKSYPTKESFKSFTDLIPGTEYQVRIRGVYTTESEEAGDVMPGPGTDTRTTKNAPAPGVKVEVTTLTTMSVSWTFDALHPERFRITVGDSDGDIVQEISTRDYSRKISGLEPRKKYSVRVSAVYRASGAEFVTEEGKDSGVTKTPEIPSVKVKKERLTTLDVTWTLTATKTVSYFLITWPRFDGLPRRVTTKDFSYTLNHLTPGTEYKINVKAVYTEKGPTKDRRIYSEIGSAIGFTVTHLKTVQKNKSVQKRRGDRTIQNKPKGSSK